MARQNSTDRSRAGRHRWHVVSDARDRLRMVRSGRGDRPCEDPYRPQPAALRDGPAIGLGRTPDRALAGLKMAGPVQTADPEPARESARKVSINFQPCRASPGWRQLLPG